MRTLSAFGGKRAIDVWATSAVSAMRVLLRLLPASAPNTVATGHGTGTQGQAQQQQNRGRSRTRSKPKANNRAASANTPASSGQAASSTAPAAVVVDLRSVMEGEGWRSGGRRARPRVTDSVERAAGSEFCNDPGVLKVVTGHDPRGRNGVGRPRSGKGTRTGKGEFAAPAVMRTRWARSRSPSRRAILDEDELSGRRGLQGGGTAIRDASGGRDNESRQILG